MAAEEQVVRITYQELKEIVVAGDSAESADIRNDKQDASPSPRPVRQQKNRRPARALYRPGQLRQGSETKSDGISDSRRSCEPDSAAYDDPSWGSKESSVEKQLDDLHIESPLMREGGRQYNAEKNVDYKKRSKRPDIRIYKPKVKPSERDKRSEEKEIPPSDTGPTEKAPQDEEVHQPIMSQSFEAGGGGGGSLPRRVHVKSQEGNAGMRVTVRNDDSLPSSPITGRREFGARRNDGMRGRGGDKPFDRGMKGKYYNKESLGGETKVWREGSRRVGGGNNPDNRNSAFKSYSKNRRSNSSDSMRKDREEGKSDPRDDSYNFSSETFPRAKSSANKSKAMSSSREVLNAGSGGGGGGSSVKGSGGGRDGDKLYLGVTRQRTGSVSSDASAASFNSNGSFYSGSSDWYTEEEEPEHIVDWGEEVEKAHLEELARLVHHGAQELTSSLNVYPGGEKESTAANGQPEIMSTSQTQVLPDRPLPLTEKNIRNRSKRRHRRRKPSSQFSSRDSSVHSSIQGEEDVMSERGGNRRRRRRHHSGRSQSGKLEDEAHPGGVGDGDRRGLQVTIGRNNRFVEINRDGGGRNQPQQYTRRDQQHAQDVHGRDGSGRLFGNSAMDRQNDRLKWEKDVPPRFRKDSGGGGGGDSSGKRTGVGRGRGNPAKDLVSDGEGPNGRRDRRSEEPAHDGSSNSRFSHHGRGRVVQNNRRGSWDGGVGGNRTIAAKNNIIRDNKAPGVTQKNNRNDEQESRQHNQGIIHLPVKVNISQQQHHPPYQSGVPATTSANLSHLHHTTTHHHQHLPTSDSNKAAAAQSSASSSSNRGPVQGQRQLFDPNNPTKPIMIPGTQPSPPPVPMFQDPEGLSPSPGSVAGLSPSPDSPKPAYPPPQMFYPPMYGYRPPMMPFPPRGPYPMGPPFPQGTVPPHVFYRFPHMASPDMTSFYGCGDLEGDNNGGSKAQCQLMAEQILQDSSPFESQLGNILSRRPLSEDSERMLNQIRFELQNRLEQVILLDIEVANKRNVEQALWKSVYYQIIEAHRKRMAEQPEDKSCKERLIDVLNEGHRFFENLLQKLQTTHCFELDLYTDGNRAVPEVVNRNVKLALLSAQRVMMFLGDIARYKEQVADTANFGKARSWYLKAQKLHPRNGRPYNQLAILAVYTKRKLDAVYYYMRSLAASNPIMTARESLMSLFDEVRRKVEIVEKKRLEEQRQRLERHRKRKSMGTRLEIWYTPDGVPTKGTVDENEEEEDLSALSAVELNKRFVLTYLNVHGKLFTKINFEGFAESSSLMLLEFETLLQHSPCVMSSTRLLQLMGINMFSIDNTALKDESLEASCRSVLQEHAVQVGLEMFGLLVKRAANLLSGQREKDNSDGGPKEGGGGRLMLDEDLHQMLPALKTWVDWMMCHALLWNPQPFNRPPELGPDIDVWQNLALLCDLLNDLDKGPISVTREQLPDMEPVVLLEDSMLAGFVPMLSAPQEVFYTDKDTNKRQSEDWLRIEKLSLFGEYLCGVEPPMLAFDVDKNKYHSVAPLQLSGENAQDGNKGGDQSPDEYDDVEIEPMSEEEGDSREETSLDSIQRLKLKKAELSRKKVEQEKNKESMEAILASHRHAKIELEIHPIFLIPDTNCFIDHFTVLKAILLSKKFTLVVPLVVINELDGLARGCRDDQYSSVEHAQMVKKQAGVAIEFLEAEFEKKHPNLRAQTSKGSILETISFRSEEASEEGINDDIILSCCLHYCQDKAREFMPKGKESAVHLYREVVLLTEDRNLRLKAHTCNVPVQDVPNFKKWSKIR